MLNFFWRCARGMISGGLNKGAHTGVDLMAHAVKKSNLVSEKTLNQTTHQVKSWVTVGEEQYRTWKTVKRVAYTIMAYPVVVGGSIGVYSGIKNGVDLISELPDRSVRKYVLPVIGMIGYGTSGFFSGIYWCARHPIYMPMEFLKEPSAFRINEYPPNRKT